MKEVIFTLLRALRDVLFEAVKVIICLYFAVSIFLPVPNMELHRIISTALALYVLYSVISERNDDK
jgi:hypothetical protein